MIRQAQKLTQNDIQAQLFEAAAKGDKDKIRMLLMAGADVNAMDEDGRTALHIASQYGQAGIYKTLLAAREMREFTEYMQQMGRAA